MLLDNKPRSTVLKSLSVDLRFDVKVTRPHNVTCFSIENDYTFSCDTDLNRCWHAFLLKWIINLKVCWLSLLFSKQKTKWFLYSMRTSLEAESIFFLFCETQSSHSDPWHNLAINPSALYHSLSPFWHLPITIYYPLFKYKQICTDKRSLLFSLWNKASCSVETDQWNSVVMNGFQDIILVVKCDNTHLLLLIYQSPLNLRCCYFWSCYLKKQLRFEREENLTSCYNNFSAIRLKIIQGWACLASCGDCILSASLEQLNFQNVPILLRDGQNTVSVVFPKIILLFLK